MQRASILPLDLPHFSSWDEVEQFVATVPRLGALTPDEVNQCFTFLARFRVAISDLPSPIPRRVGTFVFEIFDATNPRR